MEGECPWKAGLFSATLISIALLQASQVCSKTHWRLYLGTATIIINIPAMATKTSSTGQKKVSVNEGKHSL